MKQSQVPGKVTPPTAEELSNLMRDMLHEVSYPHTTTVTGFESLSIGESFNLFFKEMGASIDKRLALLARSVHTVDFDPTRKRLTKEKILFVKNTATQILVPEGYAPGMGNMMGYTKAVCLGVYIISSLKTEAARLYDWMKQIIKNGRISQEFVWTIGEFGQVLGKAETFIKNLPDNGRKSTQNLGVVYTSFEEMYDVMNTFNSSVKTIGARDAEVIVKTMGDVFDIGQLLVKKIHSNDIVLTKEAIAEVETIINRFRDFTNIAGVMMVLLNELSAVFSAQLKELDRLKY